MRDLSHPYPDSNSTTCDEEYERVCCAIQRACRCCWSTGAAPLRQGGQWMGWMDGWMGGERWRYLLLKWRQRPLVDRTSACGFSDDEASLSHCLPWIRGCPLPGVVAPRGDEFCAECHHDLIESWCCFYFLWFFPTISSELVKLVITQYCGKIYIFSIIIVKTMMVYGNAFVSNTNTYPRSYLCECVHMLSTLERWRR